VIQQARNKQLHTEEIYQRKVKAFIDRYPDVFPIELYTLELFKSCWFSILARAFGRRLPWSSMVPFADCLNHENVQTKYDFNVNNNGLFRLFPTGKNHYQKGFEVFNSYGRRPNDNLLLEYGFTLLNNEWDKVSKRMNDRMPVVMIKKYLISEILLF
jgi:hypothetical protein